MSAGEKVRHGLKEVSERLLLNDDAPITQPSVRRPGLGQLPSPLGESRDATTSRTPSRFLFHTQVPHVPRMHAVLEQNRFLFQIG
jgi:hypothetical protein